MNCSQAQDRFSELLDGRLTAADTAEVRAHLAGCPDCQREYASLASTLAALDKLPAVQPSPRLRTNFYAMLEEEKHSAASIRAAAARQRRATRVSLWRWILAPSAALAVAMGAFLAGTRFDLARSSANGEELAVTKKELATTKRELADTKKEIATLSDKVDKMGDAFVYSLSETRSATDRLNRVLATLDQRNPDQKVIADLIGSLALDPSVNVRLSALEALYPHAGRPLVRDGVLATFPREQNPLVKVAMIDFFVAAHDRDAAPELEKLTRDPNIDAAVRDAARRGLALL